MSRDDGEPGQPGSDAQWRELLEAKIAERVAPLEDMIEELTARLASAEAHQPAEGNDSIDRRRPRQIPAGAMEATVPSRALSRRMMLLGGAAATVAATAVMADRATPAAAGTAKPSDFGGGTLADTSTWIWGETGASFGFLCVAYPGGSLLDAVAPSDAQYGGGALVGAADGGLWGIGVWGQSTNGSIGVMGQTDTGIGVNGIYERRSGLPGQAGVVGDSNVGTGVLGMSETDSGVIGIAFNRSGLDGQAGVVGDSDINPGVVGLSLGSIGVDGISVARSGLPGTGGVVGDSTFHPGVVGLSSRSSGVNGVSVAASGIPGTGGVIGDSTTNSGVVGLSKNSIGVDGISVARSGIAGTGGVVGDSTTNPGVVGLSTSAAGVDGISGTRSGLPGTAGVVGDSHSGTGVLGLSAANSGVTGTSTTSVGGHFAGGRAAINLKPTTSKGRPRTGAHSRGDLVVDSIGALFLCTTAGSPGTWARVKTTSA